VHVRYHRAVGFDDVLTVWARCVDVRGARFRYEYAVTRGDEVVADGWTEHAIVDRETYHPTRVPEWLARAVSVTG
jgi:acyl-CoA thioesterase FadM